MLAQLRLNKKILIALILPIGVYAQTSSLSDYRSGPETHGLYEINEDVKKFLEIENKKNNTHWQSLEPNLKLGVSLCIVPLKISWVPKKHGRSNEGVFIDCIKTVNPLEKKWQIIVNVYDQSKVKKEIR